MKSIPEPQLRVFYSRRKSIIISRTEAQMLLQELKKWLEPPAPNYYQPKQEELKLELP